MIAIVLMLLENTSVILVNMLLATESLNQKLD